MRHANGQPISNLDTGIHTQKNYLAHIDLKTPKYALVVASK